MREYARRGSDLEQISADELIRPRQVTPEQWQRFERYVAEIFEAFGMEPDTPGTSATPRRFLQGLFDATEGYEGDPKLLTTFPNESGNGLSTLNQVVEGPIPFFALCEHHVFPFYGHAYVGYIAGEQIIGISKLTRLVRMLARRFTLQERLSSQIADVLESAVHPHGVAVYVEAHHLCIQMRGVRDLQPKTHTTIWRGIYSHQPEIRREFLELTGRRDRSAADAPANNGRVMPLRRQRFTRARTLRPAGV